MLFSGKCSIEKMKWFLDGCLGNFFSWNGLSLDPSKTRCLQFLFQLISNSGKNFHFDPNKLNFEPN